MGIINITRGWRNEDSSASSDADGNNRQRTARHVWSILVDNPTTTNATEVRQLVAAQYGFAVGSAHPDDANLIARSIRVQRISPALFMMEGGYLSRGTEPGENPLDEPPEIEQTFATTTSLLDTALDGTPIMNVNGEQFDAGDVSDEFSELVLTLTRNLPAWDYLLANAYMGSGRTPAAVNSDDFMGFPPGACRIRGLEARSVAQDGFVYFRARGTVQIRSAAPGSTVAKAWWLRVRNEGYVVRENAGDPYNQWVPATVLGTKDLSTKPVMLKLDGTREPNPQIGHWLEFQTSPSLPFADLQFFS